MNLFEDWYITYTGCSEAQAKIDLAKDEIGEYFDTVVHWMHKAFLAGQVLCDEESP